MLSAPAPSSGTNEETWQKRTYEQGRYRFGMRGAEQLEALGNAGVVWIGPTRGMLDRVLGRILHCEAFIVWPSSQAPSAR
jgi:hypothetical protein